MPRKVEIALPSGQTDDFIAEVKRLKELISLRVQRNISVQPAGDVVSLEITDRNLPTLLQLLEKREMLKDSKVSVTTSQPLSVISKPSSLEITNDRSEAIWEEMQATIIKESNMTLNSMIIMLIAGILASIGIATNALHLVIGAMVIAPGFEPLVRIALGAITENVDWRKGLVDTSKGYLMVIVGAAISTWVLQASGKNPLGGETSYLPAGVLISYWTSITFPSLLVSAVASVAGGLVIATHRSILTAGVMIALALVPTATVMGMGIATGELYIAWKAFLRWIIEIGFVTLISALVFTWKKYSVHRRRMAT